MRTVASGCAWAAALLLGNALQSSPKAHQVTAASALVAGRGGGKADTLPSFPAALRRVEACRGSGCGGVVYVWSPLMPLSLRGIPEIRAAAAALGVELALVGEPEISAWAAARFVDGGRSTAAGSTSPQDMLAEAMVAAGATVHSPAVLVHRGGRLLGPAILGYKSREAYRDMVGDRLRAVLEQGAAERVERAWPTPTGAGQEVGTTWRDIPARGSPGAYFRWAPGREAIAFEAGQVVYLLSLTDGQTSVAPGFIDLVPTPDGRFFVTPGDSRSGLEFYDAGHVFAAAQRGVGRDVRPVYVDPAMRDQYPSVGILLREKVAGGSRTLYRVLTSWYDGAVFRDYEVLADTAGGPSTVRPVRGPLPVCRGNRISIPIMSQTGRELAARNEATGTTTILRLQDDGACELEVDFGVQTGKVAWDPTGRRVAFAIPPGAVRDGSGVLWRGQGDPGQWGIFVYDRQSGATSRLTGSEQARRTTFPEFVGRERVIFLIPPASPGAQARFRLVCCLR